MAELAFEWRKLKLQRVRHIVLDEVDDTLRPPHLDHMRRLLDSSQDGRPLQLVFASATADTPPVRRAAAQLLKSPLLLRLRPPLGADGAEVGSPELPACISHGVYTVAPQKSLEAVRALHHTKPPPKCLVFVNSPHRAKIVCEKLWESYAVPAAPLYGEQEREERVDVMRRLLDGRVRIAVTTEMGARGLDIPGLTHVVNLELPTDAKHYVHRAGRCGRAGVHGTVVSIVPPGKTFVVSKLTSAVGVPLVPMSIEGGELRAGAHARKANGRIKKSKVATRRGGRGTFPAAERGKQRRKNGYPRAG